MGLIQERAHIRAIRKNYLRADRHFVALTLLIVIGLEENAHEQKPKWSIVISTLQKYRQEQFSEAARYYF